MKKNPFGSIDQTGVGQLNGNRHREGSQDAPRHQARHLRRTRRRSGFREILSQAWPDLRELLNVSACQLRAWLLRKLRLKKKRKAKAVKKK